MRLGTIITEDKEHFFIGNTTFDLYDKKNHVIREGEFDIVKTTYRRVRVAKRRAEEAKVRAELAKLEQQQKSKVTTKPKETKSKASIEVDSI